MKNSLLLLIIFLLLSCGAGQHSNENRKDEKPVVAAVNYPLLYFAERIGGDYIQLEFPIPADVDPAYWIPDVEAINIYQSAEIILANGTNYAKWMNNVSLPSSKIIYTSRSAQEKYIVLKGVSTHSHGPEGEHEHAGYAFTTWLDFEMAIVQAKVIKEILTHKMPENEEIFENNFKALRENLTSFHEQMVQLGMNLNNQDIIGSHPVYQYLSKAYGLKIHSVHFEPNEMPTNDQWTYLDHLLDHSPSKIMLWEDQPIEEVETMLNERGLKVVVFNPCGNKPESGNFIEIMDLNIKSLNKIMKQ